MSKSPLALNEGETVIRGSAPTLESVYKRTGFVLTTERVIQVVKTGLASRSFHSIGLDKIDSVYAKFTSNLGLIIFGLVLLISGVILWTQNGPQSPEARNFGIGFTFLGVFLVIVALLTRKKTIEIVSGSAKMMIDMRQVSVAGTNTLVTEIEQAKVKREVSLRSANSTNSIPKTSTASVEERLSQLAALYSKGVISQPEYESKREQLISSL
jgi:hypothetical protein